MQCGFREGDNLGHMLIPLEDCDRIRPRGSSCLSGKSFRIQAHVLRETAGSPNSTVRTLNESYKDIVSLDAVIVRLLIVG